MQGNLADFILRVCSILNKHAIEYMIVGGAAVGLHGYFRKSTGVDGEPSEKLDLDIWYNPTYQNYFKLLNAIEELGQDVEDFRNEQMPNPKTSFFKYDLGDLTLDFLPSLKAKLVFGNSFKKSEFFSIDNTDIPFINLDDLIDDKKINARAKDLEDIEYLKRKKQGR